MTEKLEQELDRLKKIRDIDHWDPVRGPQNFIRSKISTPTGDRSIWIPRDNNHNKDLQSSRSVGLGGVKELKDIEIITGARSENHIQLKTVFSESFMNNLYFPIY